MRKGQSEIVGFMVVTLIILVVVSGVFFWSKGMVEQSNDFNEVGRFENKMRELGDAVIDVANNHGQRTVVVDINKGWLFLENNHTITYSVDFELPAAKHSSATLIGNGSSAGPCYNSSAYEIIGEDKSYCLIEGGEIDLKVKFITMYDNSSDRYYQINLTADGSASAGKGLHNVLVRYKRTDSNSSHVFPLVGLEIS